MSGHPTISGSCLCQQVRYELTGDPQVKLLCHCDNCRKVTGSSFMANAVYQEDVRTDPPLNTQTIYIYGLCTDSLLATSHHLGRRHIEDLQR